MRPWKCRTAAIVCAFLISVTLTTQSHSETATRSTLALTYREGSGTQVDMVGRDVRKGTLGRAEVKRSEGRTRVKLNVDALPHPQSLG
jgi:hypothetical protein